MTVSNNVGSQKAWKVVKALYPITYITSHVLTNLKGETTKILLQFQGGNDTRITVDFGDGTITIFSKEFGNLELTLLEGDRNARGYIPEYTTTLYYNYTDLGTYILAVNASNMVSFAQVEDRAVVEEVISGITMSTTSPSLIQLGRQVVVKVNVDTGNDLSFMWDFEDTLANPSVKSSLRSSEASHVFSADGDYTVRVYVGNPWHSDDVMAALAFPFTVVEPIDGINIQTEGPIKALELKQQSDQWRTDNVTFKAE